MCPSAYASSSSRSRSIAPARAWERSIGLGGRKREWPDRLRIVPNRQNWTPLRTTRRSVSSTSSPVNQTIQNGTLAEVASFRALLYSRFEPAPHGLRKTTIKVMIQKAVRKRSSTLSGVNGYCCQVEWNQTSAETRWREVGI